MEQTVPEEKRDEVMECLSEAMFRCALASKVLSYLAFKTSITFGVIDGFCPTAHVDKNNQMTIDYRFWLNLPNHQQRAFVILHEVMHIYFEHLPRFIEQNLQMQRANVAADHFNNLTLKGHIATENTRSLDKKIQKYVEVPDWVYADEKYVGWGLEEIYQDLPEDDGSGSGDGGKRCVEDMSQWEETSKSREITEALAGAFAYAKSCSIGSDSLDAMLTDKIDALLEAPIDYKGVIANMLAGGGQEYATYAMPSNRADDDIILPTMEGDKVHLLFGVDSSGSMGIQDYREAAGAILEALNQFDDWRITLLSCDTKAHVLGEYSSEDGDEFVNINMEFIGNGGTDMSPLAQYSKEMVEDGEELSACIIVTDGYIPDSVDEYFDSTVDNMVLVTSNGNKDLNLNNAHVVHIR